MSSLFLGGCRDGSSLREMYLTHCGHAILVRQLKENEAHSTDRCGVCAMRLASRGASRHPSHCLPPGRGTTCVKDLQGGRQNSLCSRRLIHLAMHSGTERVLCAALGRRWGRVTWRGLEDDLQEPTASRGKEWWKQLPLSRVEGPSGVKQRRREHSQGREHTPAYRG